MTPDDLIAELENCGVAIEVVDGEVRLDAPAGAVTPELLASVKDSKSELLELLSKPVTSPQSKADIEFDRFERVAVPMPGGGWRDPGEPTLRRGVTGEELDALVATAKRLRQRREGLKPATAGQ